MIVGASGITSIFFRTRVIFGWLVIRSVTNSENKFRSTARAEPAGTVALFAQSRSRELNFFNSEINIPEARSGKVEPSEFEHTSSARFPVECAPVGDSGRISYSETEIPLWAACQAASLPDKPPPITTSSLVNLFPYPADIPIWFGQFYHSALQRFTCIILMGK